MAIKDNPGLTTRPRTDREWNKFINELTNFMTSASVGGFVTVDTNQTITGVKTFTQAPLVGTNEVWHNGNVGTQINALTAEAAPDELTDYVVIYNDAAGAGRKVLLDDLPAPAAAVSADDEFLHWWFD